MLGTCSSQQRIALRVQYGLQIELMTRVAVVIPYYQRKPGLLRVAFDSIYAQRLPDGVTVDVYVADDQSPHPPEPETEGLSRPGFQIHIVKRPNGGPARARNTGLEAAKDADVIAFLDSDDEWAPDHLATGLAALNRGAQFFFSNNFYEGDRTWFAGFANKDRLVADSTDDGDQQFSLPGAKANAYFLDDCLAHTSTVIYDARKLPGLLFDVDQERAGEDYLFWITAVNKSDRVAFSLKTTATRGSGIDLYRSALDWNNPDCVRRLYYALTLHKKMRDRFCETPKQRKMLNGKLSLLRRGITYLFIRNAFAHAGANAKVMGQLWKVDRAFWLNLPLNAPITVVQKLFGRLDFPIG